MTHALEIDRVSLGYPQGGAVKTVLHDFDLAVRSGELVSLLWGQAAWANRRCCACWRG